MHSNHSVPIYATMINMIVNPIDGVFARARFAAAAADAVVPVADRALDRRARRALRHEPAGGFAPPRRSCRTRAWSRASARGSACSIALNRDMLLNALARFAAEVDGPLRDRTRTRGRRSEPVTPAARDTGAARRLRRADADRRADLVDRAGRRRCRCKTARRGRGGALLEAARRRRPARRLGAVRDREGQHADQLPAGRAGRRGGHPGRLGRGRLGPFPQAPYRSAPLPDHRMALARAARLRARRRRTGRRAKARRCACRSPSTATSAKLDFDDRTKLRMAKALTVNGLPYASLLYVWLNQKPVDTVYSSPHTERVAAHRGGKRRAAPRPVGERAAQRARGLPARLRRGSRHIVAVGIMTDYRRQRRAAPGVLRRHHVPAAVARHSARRARARAPHRRARRPARAARARTARRSGAARAAAGGNRDRRRRQRSASSASSSPSSGGHAGAARCCRGCR